MTSVPTTAIEERAVIRKAAVRLLPFLCLLYFVAFLDRVNVGFAALTMNQDIGLSATAYGFGAGVFFLGYFLFEVPSNLLLKRFGARRWIARIMVSWGLVSIAMAFAQGPTSFWTLRFLLGVAEAGFFPGIILYLTFWFPNHVRGAMIGYFLLANPLSSVIGAPLSTALLGTTLFGLSGWQTMFVLEGLPAIVLGIVVLRWLRDSPAQAEWLSARERDVLTAAVARDHKLSQHSSLREGLVNPRVWLFAVIYFGLNLGVYGFGFWAPQMIKALGEFTNEQIGLITVIPYACGALAMFLWGRRSDRTGERRWHLTIPALVGALGFLFGSHTSNVQVAIACYTLGAIGIFAALPVFWTLPSAMLTDRAAAGGIALINSIGTLSGTLGPVMIGRLNDATGNYSAGLFLLSFSMAVAGVLNLFAARSIAPRPSISAELAREADDLRSEHR
jgi:ACS family tartrate transporter-like MFS transporter